MKNVKKPEQPEFDFGLCPYDSGNGLIVASCTSIGRVVLVCDEGDEVWLHPRDIELGDVYTGSPPWWKIIPGVKKRPKWGPLAKESELPEDWKPFVKRRL